MGAARWHMGASFVAGSTVVASSITDIMIPDSNEWEPSKKMVLVIREAYKKDGFGS